MNQPAESPFVFTRKNYLILLTGIAVLIIGYMLMSGGGSKDPSQFSPEIFSPRRITVAPIVVLIGYIICGVAIMYKDRSRQAPKS
jgi:Protein of unknown function (DUF3098)